MAMQDATTWVLILEEIATQQSTNEVQINWKQTITNGKSVKDTVDDCTGKLIEIH